VRLAALALLLSAGCGHADAALREEQAKARHYRDAYETQGQEIQELRKRVAELEAQGCRPVTAPASPAATPSSAR